MYKLKFNIDGFVYDHDYYVKLLGFVHKIIGENNIHDGISLYSYSNVHNDSFTFAALDENLYLRILDNFYKNMKMWDGCTLKSIDVLQIFNEKQIFKCASPFFIKDKNNNHLIFKQANLRAEAILLKKANFAGINLNKFEIDFIFFRKTKLIKIHDVNNKCFISSVKIKGDQKTIDFATKVGIGNSTGCGFGFIY